MKKCNDLFLILSNEYQDKRKARRLPECHFSLKDWPKKQEGYSARYAGGKLSVESGSPLTQTYALCQLGTAASAGHLADFLGDCHPRFSLRPLWFKTSQKICLSPNLSLCLPNFFGAEESIHLVPRFCKRLIENGYNAIIIGSQLTHSETNINEKLSTSILKNLFSQLHDHGIKIILKPSFNHSEELSFHDEKFKDDLSESIKTFLDIFPECDYFFWESLWPTPKYRAHFQVLHLTDPEIVLSEIHFLERCLDKKSRLIFFMPACSEKEAQQQSQWLPTLIDELSKGTTLAFNAVCGGLYDDHEKQHPFWDALRESPDSSSAPIMPILNAGLIKQGEGLWPLSNFDLIERFLARCYRHHFAGVIGLVSHLPQPGSILDCNLWVFGHSLWFSLSTKLLAETWFKAFRPFEDHHQSLRQMELARSIALEVSLLRATLENSSEGIRNDIAKLYGDLLFIRLKHLRWQIESTEPFSGKVVQNITKIPLKDYFPLFYRDLKMLLSTYLPTYSVPFSHSMDNESNLQDKSELMSHILNENHYL